MCKHDYYRQQLKYTFHSRGDSDLPPQEATVRLIVFCPSWIFWPLSCRPTHDSKSKHLSSQYCTHQKPPLARNYDRNCGLNVRMQPRVISRTIALFEIFSCSKSKIGNNIELPAARVRSSGIGRGSRSFPRSHRNVPFHAFLRT